jgi:hypothetical protein
MLLQGSTFWKGLVTARGNSLSEAVQGQLLQLHKQVKEKATQSQLFEGGLPIEDAEANTSNSCNSVGGADGAKRDFLLLLFEAAPYWKYELFL